MEIVPKNITLPRMGIAYTERVPSNNYGTTSRPLSYYDNISRENKQRIDKCNLHLHPDGCQCQELQTHQMPHQRSPTQEPLLSTTVPQKIANENIGSRHEPTRNSLRHSRMIVMGRTGYNEEKDNSHQPVELGKFVKAVVGLQTLLGLIILLLSVSLLLWAPNIRTRDNPYWSGIPLLASGIIGSILVCCCRKSCKETRNLFEDCFKLLSVLVSTAAGVGCFVACTFAILHIISLETMDCSPINQLNSTCFCKVPSFNESSLPIRSYHYVDLNCSEVYHILMILIIFSSCMNFIGGALASWYIYMHWASRYNSYRYLRVRTKENVAKT